MKHINKEQRYLISTLFKRGYSKTEIAEEIGVHKTSVGRELKRNAKLDSTSKCNFWFYKIKKNINWFFII